MQSGHWTHRLSEHMDGELSAAERAACEAHLAGCAECAGTLEELRAVVAQASLLGDLPPERDLWPDIAGRLAPRGPSVGRTAVKRAPRRRRVALTIPQLMAAAIALVLFSVGSAWLWLPGARSPAPGVAVEGAPSGVAQAAQAAEGAPGFSRLAFAGAYEDAIAQLEVEFERRRDELDPETIRVVEENLAIIDSAITDAGHALARDPSSAFLSTHLANAMRQKVDLLRRATAIDRTES